LNEEIMASFINKMKDAHENEKTWPGMILSANEKIVNKYITVLNGEEETNKGQQAW